MVAAKDTFIQSQGAMYEIVTNPTTQHFEQAETLGVRTYWNTNHNSASWTNRPYGSIKGP
jgi:hypothetical protein